MKIRAHFEKAGVMRYISHLDLQRAFIRALIRSKLDITYTEGFNPHPKLAFAVPLSMYQESICEVCDFGVNTDEPDLAAIENALRAALPRGLKLTFCECAPNKISSVVSASYIITVRTEMTAAEIKEKLSGSIIATTSGKDGEKTKDITAMVLSLEAEDIDGGVRIHSLLSASPNAVCNPALLVRAAGCEDFDIMRTELHFES